MAASASSRLGFSIKAKVFAIPLSGKAQVSQQTTEAAKTPERDEYVRRLDDERRQVEELVHKDLTRHYSRYLRSDSATRISYTQWWIERYKRRLIVGRILTFGVAPSVLGSALLGIGLLYRSAKNDDDCASYEDDDGWSFCLEDAGKHAGMWMFTVLGSVGTLIPLIIGVVNILSSKKKLERLDKVNIARNRASFEMQETTDGVSGLLFKRLAANERVVDGPNPTPFK